MVNDVCDSNWSCCFNFDISDGRKLLCLAYRVNWNVWHIVLCAVYLNNSAHIFHLDVVSYKIYFTHILQDYLPGTHWQSCHCCSAVKHFWQILVDRSHECSVASFTKEVNPWLAKLPLKISGRLASRGLTSLVKEATENSWLNHNKSKHNKLLCIICVTWCILYNWPCHI